MKATLKDKLVLSETARNWIVIISLSIAFSSFVFAASKSKPEYRQPLATIVTKSLNTSYQLSMYRDAMVSYSVQITSTLSLSGGQSGTTNLQTSPNNSTWTTIATQINNNTGSLTIGLNTANVQSGSLTGFVPASYYVRISTSGSSSFAWQSGMEVLL